MYEVYISLKGGTDISWERKMADLVLSTRDYLQARKDMMDLYHSRKPQLFPCTCLNCIKAHILEEITLLECINVTASYKSPIGRLTLLTNKEHLWNSAIRFG